jgi:hypothetical protein
MERRVASAEFGLDFGKMHRAEARGAPLVIKIYNV